MESQSVGTLQSTLSDSTKSGSSRSDGRTDEEKDEDLTKDNSASPIDLECHIQAERITKLLDEAIYKTKLAICLPHLVQEYKTLSSFLTPQHMDDLIFIFEQYENPLFATSLLNVTAMEDMKAGELSLKNRLNPELGHLMYILNSYPALGSEAENIIGEMKANLPQLPEGHHSRAAIEYLLDLENFRDLMVVQIGLTAAEELATKINTKKMEVSNEKLIVYINENTVKLKTENDEFEEMMGQKEQIVLNLEQELVFINHDAQMRLKKKILDSERQMVLATRAHAVKSEMLKEEEAESRETYEQQLRSHVMDEKNQRARRFKVETQLLSWVQKYDIEMEDKQIELDEFTEKYEDELRKCEDLEEKMAEQDKEFLPLMEEREAEYQQELTNKMTAFLHEHAARVIQSAWKEVLANRAEKKRLRKLQKQMAAEAAAAEVAAKKAEAAAKKAEAAAKKAEAEAKKAEAAARRAEKKAAGGGEGGETPA